MARLGVERDPDALLGHWVHGLLAHWLGNFEESVEAFNRGAAVSGRAAFVLTNLAVTYADWGKPDRARALYDELRAMKARRLRDVHQPGDGGGCRGRPGRGHRLRSASLRRTRAPPAPRGAVVSRSPAPQRRPTVCRCSEALGTASVTRRHGQPDDGRGAGPRSAGERPGRGVFAFRAQWVNEPVGDWVIDPPVARGTYEVARSTLERVILAHPFLEETNPWPKTRDSR